MNVKRIRMVNVYGHVLSEVELPDAGVVVVTGPNGAGKSGLFLEGVALGAFGKTLRGAPGWGPEAGGESMVALDLAGLTIERLRAKGKTTLAWKIRDDDTEEGGIYGSIARLGGKLPTDGDATFETATKAQDALERLVGSFDVWRRTAAFSSSDAAHFSLATDSERKRLLESVLGIERFDEALERCRLDLAMEDAAARSREVAIAEAYARVEANKARAAAAADEAARFAATAPEALPEPKLPGGALHGDLKAMADRAGAEARALAAKLAKLDEAVGAAHGDARRATELVNRTSGPECLHCRQPITKAHADKLRRLAADAKEAATVEAARVSAERDQLRAEHQELEHERDALLRQAGAAQAAEAAHRVADAQWRAREAERARWAQQRASLEDAYKKAAELQAAVESALRKAEAAHADGELELAALRSVESVLGLRGVRAQLLGRALGGVEAVANAWLGRLGLAGLSLRLKPYAEKKTGGHTDAISLDVTGAGAGYGYKGASAGERRRIDVALLLGLAEVAGASRGVRPGTLFFDECMDALDSDGVAHVAAALEELAQDRAVVVVTHNEELARSLSAVRRFKVEEGGKVTST
jgi:DNA repair exonuclease SbcCD ATPase subunit